MWHVTLGFVTLESSASVFMIHGGLSCLVDAALILPSGKSHLSHPYATSVAARDLSWSATWRGGLEQLHQLLVAFH
jgi:hypothetical protein